jgi:hypothetical protein
MVTVPVVGVIVIFVDPAREIAPVRLFRLETPDEPVHPEILSTPDPLLCRQPAASEDGRLHVTLAEMDAGGIRPAEKVPAEFARYKPWRVAIAPFPNTWNAVPPEVWKAALEPVALD